MKKFLIATSLLAAPVTAHCLDFYAEIEHQSIADVWDNGIQTAGAGISQELGDKIVLKGKLSALFSGLNDFKTNGKVWDGALISVALQGEVTESVYVQLKHIGSPNFTDYGYEEADVGAKFQLNKIADDLYFEGSMGMIINIRGNLTSGSTNKLDVGDIIGTLKLGYTF